ncbi:DUF2846 domain-containing protein [Coxiella burnetii]|uniref:DUF2846 domain-containing protein n=1 Tax=Coxiella burnetii TaxID=777 RepID=UPI00051F1986|nr:DUF2846 domain-containing protein [Coxiella burnetii]AIT64248.1 putative exported protein [Coxiella burnetii str. Namibia]ATN86730.1 hypothetical protein AYO29_10110 [Coxiella burnetii str. Schperling]PHH57932.1 DUF2846 domain-containing protein [Coxiella burnetii]
MRSAFNSLIIVLFLITGLSACVPLEPRFRGLEQPPANRAVIYVYRTHHLIEGAGVKDDIYVDGILKGSIGNGGVVVIKVAPGKHVITRKLHDGLYPLPTNRVVHAKAGHSYFFRIDWVSTGGGKELVPRWNAPNVNRCGPKFYNPCCACDSCSRAIHAEVDHITRLWGIRCEPYQKT